MSETAPARPFAAIHRLIHPDDKFFHCPTCQRRHRVDEDCVSNPHAMEIAADDHDLARVTQHAYEALMLGNQPKQYFRFAGQPHRLTRDELGRSQLEPMTFS